MESAAKKARQREVIIEFIERWIDRFDRIHWHDTIVPIELSQFRAMESLVDLSWLNETEAGQDHWKISTRLHISALASPLNQSILASNTDDEHGWGFCKFRQITDRRELRGQPVLVANAPIVEIYTAIVEQTATHYQGAADRQYAIQIGDKWQSAEHGRRATRHKGSGDYIFSDILNNTGFMNGRWTDHIQLNIGLQFRNQYFWRVAIGAEGGPSLAIPTDAIGVREFLQLRDKSPGKSRRTALIHWVEQHWRQLRSDPSSETMVRRHLRGATQFNWAGLSGAILVARQSLNLEHLAAVERKDLRMAGADRRVLNDRQQRQRERDLLRAQHKQQLMRSYLWSMESARLSATPSPATPISTWRRLWNRVTQIFKKKLTA